MEHWVVEAIGYGGTVFTIASYGMRTIIPLRIAGVIASVLFIVYGAAIQSWPVLITELIILPLNAMRLYQVLRLVKQVEQAANGELSADWLAPFAREQPCRAGEVVFAAGEAANYLLLIRSGSFRLKEAVPPLAGHSLMGK